MIAVFKKELNLFFSALTGYVAIAVFLIATGLFLWVFPDTSILEYGYATLESLFFIAPWVFMFLIPAITMRSFAEELGTGTFEVLMTKPLTETGIILGKYFAALTVVVFSILPTLAYYYTVYALGDPPGNLDTGAVWGSYLGLLFLGAVFTAIGIFASALTGNQIIAFMIAVFLCFVFYMAFDFLAGLGIFYAKVDDIIELIGINAHYNSISRGVLDTRDVIYFLSLIILFLSLTRLKLESRKW